MPIYEFRCKVCGHVFEMLRTMRESDEDVRCPACERKGVEKLLSAFRSARSSSEGSSCATGPFT